MSDIPPEVIPDLLYPLPVKSLLRFRCVCKSWKSLIDSPNFIKAHLKRQQVVKPNSDMKLILKGNSLFSIDFTSVCNRDPTPPQELDHPLKPPNEPIEVLDTCHGLVLISNNFNDNGLWNPSTKVFRKLPVYDIKRPDSHSQGGSGPWVAQICGGFGYDSVSDDYKIARIAQWLRNGSLLSETRVYSLKSGLWKKVQDCPNWLVSDENGNGMFAGGVLHWIASKGPYNPLFLLGLNLGTETFQEVPYPENFGKPVDLNVAVLGESLCLLRGHLNVNTNAKNFVLDRVDVWVMKEYGVKESWVKLFSVDQLDGRQHFSILKPIAYSLTGSDVLMQMDNRKFLWYNLDKKSLKYAKIGGGLDRFESFVSLGTLVPLYGGGSEEDKKKKVEPVIEDGAKNIEEGDDHVVKEFKLEV